MFNSKSSQILFFPCWIKNRSPLPITKSGALVVCEGYLKITRVLNVWLNEESNISKYQSNKNTTFQSKSNQILFFPCQINKKIPLAITRSGALYVCEGYVNITRVINVCLIEQGNVRIYDKKKNTPFNSKSIQILFFPCQINNKSALPITKSGDIFLCEGYVNITRVLNVLRNEQTNISKY